MTNPKDIAVGDTPDEITLEVQRDSTFSRHVADMGIVFHMGRDVEYSFLQTGPVVRDRRSYRADDKPDAFRIGPGVTEVARVRLSPGAALAMALELIDDVLERGDVDIDELGADIRAIMAKHESNSGDVKTDG